MVENIKIDTWDIFLSHGGLFGHCILYVTCVVISKNPLV